MSSRKESVDLRTWKSIRDGLEHSLAGVNLEELAEKLLRIDVISEDCKDKFATIDCSSTETGSRVRYLLMHVHDRVSCSVSDLNRFYRCLSEKFQLGHVLPCISDGADGAGGSRYNVDVENHVLTTDDESYLVKLLYEAAPKWEVIGLVLNLSSTARDNCRTSNCIIALANVLHEWILSSKQLCKVCVLTSALESNVVGCARIAQELKDKFERKLNQGSINSCFEEESHEEPTFDYCVHYIKIAEGKSALLEVEGTLNDTLSYQWFKDGKSLSNTSEYFGVDCAILLLYKADLVHQGMYQCHITDSMGVKLHFSGQVNVKVILTPEREYLRSVYARGAEVPPNSWPPISNTNFTNLALINVREMGKASYSYTVRGDVDDITDVGKKHIKYQDSFERFEEGSLILVEGRPGSGKTTLVHKICRDWAIDQEGKVLKHASLVFFIYLRLLTDEDKDLIDILKKLFYPDSTQSEDLNTIAQKIAQTKGKNTCFILDGLDEYDLPQRKDTVIYRLIKKKIMPNSMVIVSSRPAAAVDIRQDMLQVKRIEVLGFSKAQIDKYILEYPFCDGNIDNVHVSLRTYLKDHPNVLHICYLPVYLAIICFLYDKLGYRIPATESKIYEMFMLLTILRHLRRDDCDITVSSLRELQGETRKYFENLCRLAFDFSASSQQVFCCTNISSDAQTLGVITLDKVADIYKIKNMYAFHHLTFQEYLAAWHVAHFDGEVGGEEKQMELITLHAGKRHLKNMWKFYCGIVDFKSKISQFEVITRYYNEDCLYACQCAFESQESLACQYVIKDSTLAFSDRFFFPRDMCAIEYVIINSSCLIHLNIRCCYFRSQLFVADELPTVSSLSISYHDPEHDPSCLVNYWLTKMPNLRKLNLCFNYFNTAQLASNVTLPYLSKIRLSLFSPMSRDSIEMLKFSSSRLEDVHIYFFCGEDKEDDFDSYLCTVFGFSAIFRGQLPNVSIYDFNIKTFNGITSDHFGMCTSLTLVNCGINDELAEELANGLLHSMNLKTLTLDSNAISDFGVQILANTLRNNTFLESFSIFHNNVNELGAISLIEGLSNCKELCYLYFQCENVSVDGFKEIMLRTRKCLPELCLHIWNDSLDCSSTNNCNLEGEEEKLHCGHYPNAFKYFPNILADHLQVTGLEALPYCKNLNELLMDTYGLDFMADYLCCQSFCLKHGSKIENLDISNNRVVYFYKLKELGLCEFQSLQCLDFSGNADLFDCDGIEKVDEITRCRNLRTLILSKCHIKSFLLINILNRCKKLKQISLAGTCEHLLRCLPNIAKNLAWCLGLQILDLSKNGICTVHLKNIPADVRENFLNTLNFQENEIDEEGLAIICSLNWRALHTLNVSHNSIGSINLNVLTASLKYCFLHLDTLNISHNKIDDNAIKTLSEAMTVYKIDRMTYCKIFLKTLDLSYNLISNNGVDPLMKMLKGLAKLNLSGNKISLEFLGKYSHYFSKLECDEKIWEDEWNLLNNFL